MVLSTCFCLYTLSEGSVRVKCVCIQDDESVAAVTTDKQRDQFLAQLNDAEDWLYDAGENAPATEHQCAPFSALTLRTAFPRLCHDRPSPRS